MNKKGIVPKKIHIGTKEPTKGEKQTKQTITCMHCRYEYTATAARCTICGYPWSWLKK